MKRYFIFPLIILLFVNSFIKGQGIYDSPVETKPQPAFVPHIYVGPGVGINNISGMIGAVIELHVYKKFSLVGGLGMGSWGGKYSLQTRFYRRYPIGVFYGIGISSATGIKNYKTELEVENENDPVEVKMDLHKVNCANITIGQQFKLGKKMRLNFELGYAIPLQTNFYEVKTPGIVLKKKSKDQMDMLTPGGLIVGVGFSFGI